MEKADQYYIERCLDGHPDDFRHLVARHQWPLTAYLTGKLANKNDAEEAAQETFVRAFFALERLANHRAFNSWLFGIANRVAKEQLRAKSRMRQLSESLETDASSDEKHDDDFELERAIAQLPGRYREVILLRFYAGRSCKEIAKTLDMRIGTVTQTLSRSYKKLRKLLKKQKRSEVQI